MTDFLKFFPQVGGLPKQVLSPGSQKQQCFPELQSRTQHGQSEQTGWSVLLRLKDGFTTEKKPDVYKPVCDPVVPPSVVFCVAAAYLLICLLQDSTHVDVVMLM